MRGLLGVVAFLGVTLSACYMDAGYEPDYKYENKPVEYIVRDSRTWAGGDGCADNILPKCNDKFEGVVVYSVKEGFVAACMDGIWTKQREQSPDSSEIKSAQWMTEEICESILYAGESSSSEGYTRRSSSSSRDDVWWDDDDYYYSSDDSDDYYYYSSSSSFVYDSITDSRDGKRYAVISIGGTHWMAEDLRTLNLPAGTSYISNNSSPWSGPDSLKVNYPYLTDNICPEGFHVPNNNEWIRLIQFVGGESVAGLYLKTDNFYNGSWPNDDADSYGFKVEPLGVGVVQEDLTVLPVSNRNAYWTSEKSVVEFWGYSDYAFVSDSITYETDRSEDGYDRTASSRITRPIGDNDYFSIRCVEDAI